MEEIKLSFENLVNLAKKVIKTAKYMKSFRCDTPNSCGKGAICNSCWVRSWAKEILKWIKDRNGC